jgi:Holliday junction resolvase RusA-like endonuclease
MYTRVRGQWNRMAKRTEVASYQADTTLIVRSARPSGWRPPGQVRLTYDFYLKRDADCDNLLKVLNDAIAMALDVNDRHFLPCVRSKVVDGTTRNPRVEIHFDAALPSASSDPTGSGPSSSPSR